MVSIAIIEPVLDLITAELAVEGAQAVVVMGSFARGDASPHSDIDLLAVGEGQGRYERRGGHLCVGSWSSAEAVLASFSDPAAVGAVIPGWREARILYDPDRTAALLQAQAQAWTWDQIERSACNAYVAREIAGLAEEAHKLVAALERGARLTAAVQRNVLALRMAGIMAVHNRLLYGTENRLWDLVAAALGDPWASVQARAMGLGGESFEDTCRAALHLYVLAAQAARDVFDAAQQAIVDHACALAGAE